MRWNRSIVIFVALVMLATVASGQEQSVLALELAPQVSIPIGRDVGV